jgi:signal transduction histidine kinase
MVGLDREALIGRDITAVLPEPSAVSEDVNGEAGASREAELVDENGSTFPIEIEERKVTAGDETVHVSAVRDISKRKKWEKEILLAKQEAEQMAQLKSNLVNNMSHELRTPITNIKGYAEVIMEEAEEPHKNFASRIYDSGDRLAETLQSVLDMAQIEAGTLDVLIRDVAVANVVQEVVERHEQEIDGDVLTVEVDVPDDCALQTDRTLLYRILNNLVQNAVKFTDEGTIGIEAETMSEGIQLVVWDDGVGIDPEFRPHLFDPFKQESEGVARKYEGAGLGLSLTKRMVDILGGTIEVESTKGQGSAFTVELPLQSKGETPIVESSEEYDVPLTSE